MAPHIGSGQLSWTVVLLSWPTEGRRGGTSPVERARQHDLRGIEFMAPTHRIGTVVLDSCPVVQKMPLGEWEVVEVRGPSKPYCRDTEKDHQVLRLKFAAARLVTEGECRYGRQAETSLHVYKMVNVEHYGQVVWYTNDYDLEEGQVVKENRNHFINLNRKPW